MSLVQRWTFFCSKANLNIRARYPSGKGEVCKTFIREFDSHPRLHSFAILPTGGRNSLSSIDREKLRSANNNLLVPGSADLLNRIPFRAHIPLRSGHVRCQALFLRRSRR